MKKLSVILLLVCFGVILAGITRSEAKENIIAEGSVVKNETQWDEDPFDDDKDWQIEERKIERADKRRRSGLPRKNWFAASLLSFLIPGTGQFYNAGGLEGDYRQEVKGAIFLGISVGIQIAAIQRFKEPSPGWDASWEKAGDMLGYMMAATAIGLICAIEAGVTASRIDSGEYKLPEKKASLQISDNKLMLCYNINF